ncbi:aminoglycoside phosphotransferase family protein [Streptomyces sp. NBS 14/10]|uniref:aminoglycoside phosphotransferase family protein n=1 Tax=Streptomyces sp. NBS 14/10 TaxID=1945643 RepID=UPI00211AEEE3|nr:aminoglycoside phosphotransferase family protein [Streptomyces sp. NBS 14/10]KAK1186433.1 aminoglycoside phosphotransferase family protein [Streptomyces sp. NBS 14/10]
MTDVTRAIAAATSVAAALDLPANGAVVLHNSNKLALRLTPCDVLARVAPVGQEVAQFEVELAQRLAEVGCPVCPLEPRVDPRVYTRDGFAVTLWTYYEPVTPHTSPVDYAKALEQLHAGMRKADVPSPRFTDRITEAEEVVADPDRSPELADADRVFLSGRLASLRRAIDDRGAVEQLLHGEPHPGNVLGFPTPTPQDTPQPDQTPVPQPRANPAPRKTARRRTDVAKMLDARILTAGTRIVLTHRSIDHWATINDDGGVVLNATGGTPYGRVDEAGAVVRGTKTCQGMKEWHIEDETGTRLSLRTLRDQAVAAGLM